jgi:hypothetical protein
MISSNVGGNDKNSKKKGKKYRKAPLDKLAEFARQVIRDVDLR